MFRALTSVRVSATRYYARSPNPALLARWNSSGSTVEGYGKCPSCGAPLLTRLPACTTCAHIKRAPPSVSYYEIFDLHNKGNPFLVDEADLKRRYRNLQKVVHPDLWSNKSPEIQREAEAVSSQVNDAYNTLLKPLRRAHYILRMNGHETENEDTLEDPELVMEVMEIREALEEAENQEQVEEIRVKNQARISRTETELETLIGEKKWDDVKTAAVRLRYLLGIEEAAKAWPNPPEANH